MSDYAIQMQVRDYECDMQGIVNNAIYQHYLEHARHKFLEERGISFAELTLAGVIIVVARAELDYLSSLRAGEDFIVTVKAERPSKVRLVFHQEILHASDNSIAVRAAITTTAVNERGKPSFPSDLEKLLD